MFQDVPSTHLSIRYTVVLQMCIFSASILQGKKAGKTRVSEQVKVTFFFAFIGISFSLHPHLSKLGEASTCHTERRESMEKERQVSVPLVLADGVVGWSKFEQQENSAVFLLNATARTCGSLNFFMFFGSKFSIIKCIFT